MKHSLLAAALVAAFVVLGLAQQPRPHESEFRAFYAKFLAAVRANDKEKLADLIAFPVDDWSVERKGNVETGAIKDRAEFLLKYNSFFTPFMRSHIPRAKLTALDTGGYIIVWHDAGSEFSFDFDYIDGTGYRVRSYNIGPE